MKQGGDRWMDCLVISVGRHINLMTLDGVSRGGKMTAVVMKSIKFNGSPVEYPYEIELNGDPSDKVPLDRIESFDLV